MLVTINFNWFSLLRMYCTILMPTIPGNPCFLLCVYKCVRASRFTIDSARRSFYYVFLRIRPTLLYVCMYSSTSLSSEYWKSPSFKGTFRERERESKCESREKRAFLALFSPFLLVFPLSVFCVCSVPPQLLFSDRIYGPWGTAPPLSCIQTAQGWDEKKKKDSTVHRGGRRQYQAYSSLTVGTLLLLFERKLKWHFLFKKNEKRYLFFSKAEEKRSVCV